MAREHQIEPQAFAACKTHLSMMLADFMVDRNELETVVRILRIRRTSSQAPLHFCSCRRVAAFHITTNLRADG